MIPEPLCSAAPPQGKSPLQVKAVFLLVEHMRLQAYLTPENEVAVQQLLASVNAERAKAGLEPATISNLVNEVISRIDQMTSLNICGVYLLNRQNAAPLPVEPLKRDRKEHVQSVAILETQESES